MLDLNHGFMKAFKPIPVFKEVLVELITELPKLREEVCN
jgi:hypothetical protein